MPRLSRRGIPTPSKPGRSFLPSAIAKAPGIKLPAALILTKAFNPEQGYNYAIPINAAKKFLNYDNLVSIADFNRQISPANELTYLKQGLLLEGRPAAALDYFKQALALDPHYLKAWVNSAKAYQLMFMENEEFTAWQEVQEIDPENVPSYSQSD